MTRQAIRRRRGRAIRRSRRRAERRIAAGLPVIVELMHGIGRAFACITEAIAEGVSAVERAIPEFVALLTESADAAGPEAVHDSGRVDQRGRLLEEPVEAHEVLQGREPEELADSLLLGPDVAEGAGLEVEDRAVVVGELVHPPIFPLGTDDRARAPEQRGGGESDG